MFEIDFGNNQTFANESAEDGVITNVLMKNMDNALSIQIPNTPMGNNEVSDNDIDFNPQYKYKTFEQPDETEKKNTAGSTKTPRARTPKTKVERNLTKYKVRPPCTDKCKKCGERLMCEYGEIRRDKQTFLVA